MRIERVTKFELAKKPARVALAGALFVAGIACGAGTPPPAAPEPALSASGAPATSSEPVAQASEQKSSPPEAAPADKPPAAPDTTLEKPTRPVPTLLESSDTVYFVAFEESDAGKVAETNCAKESGGDPQKNSACMTKARQPVEGLAYRFKKDPKSGVTTCTMVRRQGNVLTTTHKFRYKYADETENSIVIKMDGKDDGPNKWEKIPSEIKIDVPNDYSIVMQDPKFGRLVYYAKGGIPGD